ncbi:hypothetical protein [Pelagimonas phthalicica]|uniref:hypothetical protein n=1 Tax=Pelagimonas phthalicica TaxID=1037362 RepID=UPI000C07E691|nr:hypothetical protein [Pelagimonas phthalicica]TDS91777.1 hypothetical protein CLV87_2954 [Pelagimonas phthalicica]
MKPSELISSKVNEVTNAILEMDDNPAVRKALVEEALLTLMADAAERVEIDKIDLVPMVSSALHYVGIGVRDLQEGYHPDVVGR